MGGGNLSFDIQDRGKDGITRATIGLGNVTIKGVTPEAAAAVLEQINRDPSKLQEVLAATTSPLVLTSTCKRSCSCRRISRSWPRRSRR